MVVSRMYQWRFEGISNLLTQNLSWFEEKKKFGIYKLRKTAKNYELILLVEQASSTVVSVFIVY